MLGIANCLPSFAQDSQRIFSQDRESNDAFKLSKESLDRSPPNPWLLDAPPRLARLIDRGNVRIVGDQAAVDAAGRTALTIFTFSLEYRMRFRMSELPRDKAGTRSMQIAVSYFEVKSDVFHKVLLSNRFQPLKPWESALLQHEFDHVAISTDPRMFAILRSLNGTKATLMRSLEAGIKVTDAWAKDEIETSVKELQQAVESLVRHYYVELDRVSSNGLVAIEDRNRFFLDLFSEENLARNQFAYFEQAQKNLKAIEVEDLQKHYGLP